MSKQDSAERVTRTVVMAPGAELDEATIRALTELRDQQEARLVTPNEEIDLNVGCSPVGMCRGDLLHTRSGDDDGTEFEALYRLIGNVR